VLLGGDIVRNQMMGTTMKSKANEDLQGLDEGTVNTRNSIVGDRRDSLLDMSLP
jgi:hypothetical protein